MNTQRLQALATFLRTVPQEHFNLESWRDSNDSAYVSDEVLVSHACGTTACAVGWACAMPEFKEQGLAWGNHYPTYTFTEDCGNTTYEGWDAVMEFFDIDYITSEYFFSAEEYSHIDEGKVTPATSVADRIESTICTRTVGMKTSGKLALSALCMVVVTGVAFTVGLLTQSVHWSASSIGFLLLALAFFSEALAYADKGR